MKPLPFLLLLLPLWLSGQSYVDLLKIGYGYSPETTFEDDNLQTGITFADYDLLLPIPLGGRTTLLTGSTGAYNRLQPDPGSPELKLYSAALYLGLNLTHRNGWTSTHMLLPRLASAFDNGRAQWQWGTLQLLERKRGDRQTLGFGFYLNTEEYGVMWVPLLTYYLHHPQDAWEVRLLFPSRGDFNVRLSERWRAGTSFDALGSSFPIETPEFGPAYVQRISNDLSLYLQHHFSPSLLIGFKAGYSIARSYRVYGAEDTVKISIANIFFDDPRSSLNQSVRSGLLFQFRLTYRFHLPTSE